MEDIQETPNSWLVDLLLDVAGWHTIFLLGPSALEFSLLWAILSALTYFVGVADMVHSDQHVGHWPTKCLYPFRRKNSTALGYFML